MVNNIPKQEETLKTLEINVLSNEQYEKEKQDGNLIRNAFYLTPDTSVSPAEVEDIINLRYFNITQDGVLSIRPEYRADGSKYNELPRIITLPNAIDGITVTSLSPYMFAHNSLVEDIKLPDGLKNIPEYCFAWTYNLTYVRNTEYIETVGTRAFMYCYVENLEFPNLKSMAEQAFISAPNLETINIGNVTEIPFYAFAQDRRLYSVVGGRNVETIGEAAFFCTDNLYRLEPIWYHTLEGENVIKNYNDTLDKIERGSFIASAFDDFGSILEQRPQIFEEYSIECSDGGREAYNALKYKIKQQENPVPTCLSQHDPRWSSFIFYGDKINPETYASGCKFVSFIHAYCGLYGLSLNSPDEFESILREIEIRRGKSLIEFTTESSTTWYEAMADFFDLNCEVYKDDTVEEKIENLYTAFADGKYAIVPYPSILVSEDDPDGPPRYGHVVMANGIRDDGRLCIVDSAPNPGMKSAIPCSSLLKTDSRIYIYSRKYDPQIYNGEATINQSLDAPYYNGETSIV